MNYSYTNIRISDEAIGIQKMPHFSPLRDPGLAIAYNFRKGKSFVWYFLQTIGLGTFLDSMNLSRTKEGHRSYQLGESARFLSDLITCLFSSLSILFNIHPVTSQQPTLCPCLLFLESTNSFHTFIESVHVSKH